MSFSSEQSPEAKKIEVLSLKSQIADLSKYKIAMEAQEKLFRSILMMGNVATGKLMLRSVILEITELSRELVRAKDASLFMLDDKGVITESILARGPTVREEKDYLIGETLEKGLAGWVARYRRMALVKNTDEDDRWFHFSRQPYKVGSALCLPFLRGSLLLGILTLTHPKPKHFTEEMADFMMMYSPSISIALDYARMYLSINSK
ncbi:GAF domain-containing protein [Geminocystis sp. NIES-3709]|uniref:GAF domain-containing protein n=1 Tax=Geminocystis sp. NIES-3709 TaxID=1617448 RepID=UPI0005FC9ED4|nr:GAF domain-containing protein [Geminocystis sp. NIES-3709]BAQ65228.1 serine phosphatase [Geminocystis sp. NIES-3709]